MNLPTHDQMVQAIVSAHSQLKLPVQTVLDAFASNDEPVYSAVQQACRSLGFIDIDAQCVASAWQSQCARCGHFDPNAWPDDPVDFGLAPWPRKTAFASCPQRLGLYAVLPDAAWVGRMARAGVPTVQLRFKSDDPEAITRETVAAVEAVRGTPALLFINDHWQAAIDAGAYGVHLGQEDMQAANLATLREAGLRLGLSSHGYAEMVKADAFSPSYIAMGAVYATTLKRMVTPPQGPGRLHAYARLMRNYPLVGIGGIDASNINDVLASGVGSVAVVRALVAADDPQGMASSLIRQIDAAQNQMFSKKSSAKPAL